MECAISATVIPNEYVYHALGTLAIEFTLTIAIYSSLPQSRVFMLHQLCRPFL